MKLSEWMKEQELTQELAEERLGIDQTTISRILRGKPCKASTMAIIFERTDGKVTANDLLGMSAD